jgi:2'-5' RNA ligase
MIIQGIPSDHKKSNYKQMKSVGKYFLAIVPPKEIFDRAESIKEEIREKFGVKYALKSPAHITLKMPFNYNEAKEESLISKVGEFLKDQASFQVRITGVGTFGNRVIYLDIDKSQELETLQNSLKSFCKKELNLADELSDRNYHPHMTIAFKDLKVSQFPEVLKVIKSLGFRDQFQVSQIALLKRIDGRWILNREIGFGGGQLEQS